MRFPTCRLPLLASLSLLLLSTACATASTSASIARTERARLPALSPELVKRERIAPLEAKPSGEPVTIDRSILGELVERFAEALAAIARGNVRAAGVELERRCTAAILSTGTVPADCPR